MSNDGCMLAASSLQRAIELGHLAADMIAQEHLHKHRNLQAAAGGTGPITTLGIMFDEKTCVVENVLVGGPAFNSQKVFKGDTILSIDGQAASKGDLGTMLRGTDKPDSIVTIGLKRVSGNVENVKLQRMVSSQLAEKREMFELFTLMTNRAKIGKDKVLETTVQKVFDLWTAEMLEEYEHDAITANDIHEMQECCKRWLEELLQILEADAKVVGIQKKTTKSVRAAPPPAGGKASVSEEDLEKLRAELENFKKKFTDLEKENALCRKTNEDLVKDSKNKEDEIERLKMLLAAKEKELADQRAENAALKSQLENALADLKKQSGDLSGNKNDEIERLEKLLAAKEKELADQKAENAALKSQLEKTAGELSSKENELKTLREHLAAMEAEFTKEILKAEEAAHQLREQEAAVRAQLEASQAETASARAALPPKDAEIDELKRRLAALETEMEKARYLSKETAAGLEALRQKLDAMKKELQIADEALQQTNKSLQALQSENESLNVDLVAKDAELENLKRILAQSADGLEALRQKLEDMKKELQIADEALQQTNKNLQALQSKNESLNLDLVAKDAEIENLKRSLAQEKELTDCKEKRIVAIEQELTDSKVNMQALGTKCRELIALSQRCIAEDHLTEHEILTTADQNSTTLGVMIREKADKVVVEYILVGSPAFKSKMVEKGDVIVAVDGKAINGDAMFMSALADRQGTSVTLSIKKQGKNAPVDVELQSMPTNLIADKRKFFDLFDSIERRFLKVRDTIGKQHVDDALALWTQMCMEEIDHDHKCRTNVEAMQTDTDKWLSECDAILAQLLGQPEKERPVTHKIAARAVKSAPHLGTNEAVESASEGSSNQEVKRMELALKEETEKRKALETKLQHLEKLDSVAHVAYICSSEGSEGGGVPGPVSGSPTSKGVTGFFNTLSIFGSTKNDDETKSKVVTDIQGPVTFDEDFLLDLCEMQFTDCARDARVMHLNKSLESKAVCLDGGAHAATVAENPLSSGQSSAQYI